MDIARRLSRLSLLALVSVAVHSSPAGAQVPGVTGDTIKIGTFGPLTGPNYLFGKLVMNGAEIVYNEANKAGGIQDGRRDIEVCYHLIHDNAALKQFRALHY